MYVCVCVCVCVCGCGCGCECECECECECVRERSGKVGSYDSQQPQAIPLLYYRTGGVNLLTGSSQPTVVTVQRAQLAPGSPYPELETEVNSTWGKMSEAE